MEINLGFFQFASWKRKFSNGNVEKGCWFRVFGWGIRFTNERLNFSERNGYKKIRSLPFGYRWNFLKKLN